MDHRNTADSKRSATEHKFRKFRGAFPPWREALRTCDAFAHRFSRAPLQKAALRAPAHFESLGEKMAEAKAQYEAVKVLDEELFGEDFVAA